MEQIANENVTMIGMLQTYPRWTLHWDEYQKDNKMSLR